MPPPIDGDGGSISAFWSHPVRCVDELTQEACRNNGHHAQNALASALHSAEIAWNQRGDVYARQASRYVAAMELLSQQLLTGDMQGNRPIRWRPSTFSIPSKLVSITSIMAWGCKFPTASG
jgi:hypothetical protein